LLSHRPAMRFRRAADLGFDLIQRGNPLQGFPGLTTGEKLIKNHRFEIIEAAS